jgi:DNA-binding transcriptional ArsR family regulator
MVTYRPAMDEVFKALGDPTRRLLLDRLFERDGRTLGDLEAGLEMTRFGVMKHLRVLEEAGLVLTRRRGREKLHFLNPVPIRLVHDRWVSKFAAPWASALSDLKRELEEETMEKVFEIYIKTTPERLWQAITDGEMRRRFSFGVGVESAWTPGSAYTATTGPETVSPGMPISEGENLVVEAPRRLVQSFRALWGEDVVAEGTSRVTWEIEPVADSCRLTVTHDQLREGANDQLFGGWPMILSGLKTLLETGETLTTPASLMYLADAPDGGAVGPATSRQMAEMPGGRGD